MAYISGWRIYLPPQIIIENLEREKYSTNGRSKSQARLLTEAGLLQVLVNGEVPGEQNHASNDHAG